MTADPTFNPKPGAPTGPAPSLTRAEALALLQACRPGDADQADPRMAEALKLAEQDPELARRFAALQAFDAAVAERVQSIPVPAQLKAALLAERPRARAPFWRRDLLPLLLRPATGWALALVVAALVGWAGRQALEGPPSFADYRQQVLEEAWEGGAHLDLRTTDRGRLAAWLKERGVAFEGLIPSSLAEMTIHGCRLMRWRGYPVVVLCLFDRSQHYHLFVSEGIEFPDPPPEDKPDYESCGRRRTVAWSLGERVYVLEGMKYFEFTKRFRKDGLWRLSGQTWFGARQPAGAPGWLPTRAGPAG